MQAFSGVGQTCSAVISVMSLCPNGRAGDLGFYPALAALSVRVP